MHTANQPWNVLDGADKQSTPRSGESLARLSRYSSVLRSYCAAGDPVCAGGNVVAEHLNYFELYTDEATSWIVSKVDGTAPLCAASSSAAVPTPTTTAAASSVAVSSTAAADSTTVVQAPTTTFITSTVVAKPVEQPTTLITATVIATPAPAPACNAVY
jgi:hypothetical protein